AAMFKVDAPVRMSTPGQSISGADGVGDLGWVTPGFALAKRLATRLLNDGSSPPSMLEIDEQPDSSSAPPASANAPRRLRLRSSRCPGPIEISQLFSTESSRPMPL